MKINEKITNIDGHSVDGFSIERGAFVVQDETNRDSILEKYRSNCLVANLGDESLKLYTNASVADIDWLNASNWQSIGGGTSYSFSNGVSESAGNVKLGGADISENTDIHIPNAVNFFKISADDLTSYDSSILLASSAIMYSVNSSLLSTSTQISQTAFGYSLVVDPTGSGSIGFNIDNSGFTIDDSVNNMGIVLYADYSDQFIDESLVSKRYVDKNNFIMPSYTTLERDALTAVNGMIVYNTDTNVFNFYENGAWVTK